MKIIGVDPGASGALAIVQDGKLVAVHDMPTYTSNAGKRRIETSALAKTVLEFGGRLLDRAVIEQVGPMPRDGSAGSFYFGKAAGLAEGVIAGLGVPITLVTPQRWKKRLDVPAGPVKAIRDRATALFHGDGKWWPLQKHDGRAEAAMIALWGYLYAINGDTFW